MLKAILIDCIPPALSKEDSEFRLTEAESLIKTYGGIVLVKTIQKKTIPDYRTYIGSGKVNELIQMSKELNANIIIVNNELKPQQTYNLNELLLPAGIEAWDRIDVILKIFKKHASTKEAQLEIEMASIKHMGPRIFGMGMQLSRQGGGIGTKGVGETNTELMKRHLIKLERKIKEELEACRKVRKLHRDSRKRKEFKTIGIIGYTNAGKSSLLNALTRKGAYAANKLFATLDTRVGKMYLPVDPSKTRQYDSPNEELSLNIPPREVLVSDTIGFIQDLPTTLIKSFQSTLEETIDADLLLHIIDLSDPRYQQKIEIVNEILSKIEVLQKPTIYVFNKIDATSPTNLNSLHQQFEEFTPCFTSAITGEGIEDLKKAIREKLAPLDFQS